MSGITGEVSTVGESSEDNGVLIGVVVGISSVVLVIMGVVIALLLFRRKRNKGHNTESISVPLESETPLKDIDVKELLGSGNFGE